MLPFDNTQEEEIMTFNWYCVLDFVFLRFFCECISFHFNNKFYYMYFFGTMCPLLKWVNVCWLPFFSALIILLVSFVYSYIEYLSCFMFALVFLGFLCFFFFLFSFLALRFACAFHFGVCEVDVLFSYIFSFTSNKFDSYVYIHLAYIRSLFHSFINFYDFLFIFFLALFIRVFLFEKERANITQLNIVLFVSTIIEC